MSVGHAMGCRGCGVVGGEWAGGVWDKGGMGMDLMVAVVLCMR